MGFFMMELLQRLWPEFSALATGESDALSVYFWLAMVVIFIATLFFMVRQGSRFSARMRALNSLLEGQSKESLAGSRRETLQKVNALEDRDVRLLWSEFDESLVITEDQKKIFNTLDASYFFNAKTLAAGLTGSRLLAAVPSFLVALGVLGTFVGLTIGLSGLDGTSGEVETLKSGINELISGATVAFMTSVWGVFFSLVLNFIEKLVEGNVLNKISKLQQRIDGLYQHIPAEQSLLNIAEYSKESKHALQELHERIGDRLQETLSGMSDAMQHAVTDALNTVMAPAIQALVNNSSEQSSQVLTALVEQFMSGMASAGREQSGQMQQAATDVNTAVSSIGERLDHLFTNLNGQQSQQLELAREQSAAFSGQLQELASTADAKQEQLEQRFGQLMTSLSSQIETQLAATQSHDEQRQAAFTQQINESSTSQTVLLEQLSQTVTKQVQSMHEVGSERDKSFESIVSNVMAKLDAQLVSQVEASENREQGRQQRFNEQLDAVATQQKDLLLGMASAVSATQQQSIEMAKQHQQLLDRLQQTTEAVKASSENMGSSANQLGLLSTNVRQASEVLGQRLESMTEGVAGVSAQSTVLATQLQSQADSLSQLQVALLQGAERFEQAASIARSGFGDMKQSQEEFLAGVKNEFTALGEMLRSQVETIEKQAESWLQSYAKEVHTQTDDRMNKWNEVSLSYADQMHRNVQAVSGILDELEAR